MCNHIWVVMIKVSTGNLLFSSTGIYMHLLICHMRRSRSQCFIYIGIGHRPQADLIWQCLIILIAIYLICPIIFMRERPWRERSLFRVFFLLGIPSLGPFWFRTITWKRLNRSTSNLVCGYICHMKIVAAILGRKNWPTFFSSKLVFPPKNFVFCDICDVFVLRAIKWICGIFECFSIITWKRLQLDNCRAQKRLTPRSC